MPFTVRILVSLLAFAVSAVIGVALIPFLKKIHFGQTILDIGPNWHKSKQGTPIMGGFMFIIGSIFSVIVGYTIYRLKVLDITNEETTQKALKLLACIIYSLLFSAIGFADDYIKAVKKRNMGLNAKQKTFFQILFSGGLLGVLYALGDTSTQIDFIFAKVDFGLFYYPIMVLFMYFISNAVNLTDGVDGLCGSVTVITMLTLTTVCTLDGQHENAMYAIAVAGGCLGFLVWNLHPAKCFMGDTGSMFLGGAFVALGISTGRHLLAALIGIIYICEALSVVIQVTYFKITARSHFKKTGEKGKGKRIFKMSPIHHHFEMSGYSEYKIVGLFSAVSIIAGIIAIIIVK